MSGSFARGAVQATSPIPTCCPACRFLLSPCLLMSSEGLGRRAGGGGRRRMVVPGSPLPCEWILQTSQRGWKWPQMPCPSPWQSGPVLGFYAAQGVQGLNNNIITIILPAQGIAFRVRAVAFPQRITTLNFLRGKIKIIWGETKYNSFSFFFFFFPLQAD